MGVEELFFAYWDWYLLIGFFVTIWFFLLTTDIPSLRSKTYGPGIYVMAGAIVWLMWPAVIIYRYSK